MCKSVHVFGIFWIVVKHVSMLWLFCDIFDSARYGLVDAYSSNGNVTEDEVFRGWPIEQHENRVWFLFGALWRVTWCHTSVSGRAYSTFSKQSPGGREVFDVFGRFLLLSFEFPQVIWPERDYCACVEAYDYHTTMHALFETSLHIGTFSSFAPKVAFCLCSSHSKGSDSTILV